MEPSDFTNSLPSIQQGCVWKSVAQVARGPGQGRSKVVAVLNQGQVVAPLVGLAPACKDVFCGNARCRAPKSAV